MPRYYLHAIDRTGIVRDDCGVELEDRTAAYRYALAAVREIVADDARRGHLAPRGHLDVTDAAGALLFRLPYRDAFHSCDLGGTGQLADNDDDCAERSVTGQLTG